MYLIAIGEIFLKGKNRITFERRLIRNIREALNLKPDELIKLRNRYIITKDTDVLNIEKIFGIIFYAKCIKSDLDKINETALSLIANEKTFRISAKKSITLNKSSTKINEELGSYILSKRPDIKVDLENPDIEIKIEELRNKAYIYTASNIIPCQGGLPLGTGGFAHLRVNDEINSTVAGFLIMKRGIVISMSKDLPLLHKFEFGTKLKIREEKGEDIIITDETDLNQKQDEKFILRPLVGYSEKEIKELYDKIIFI